MVNRSRAWLHASIKQYTDIRLEDRAEGVKEPLVGMYFHLTLCLEAEYYLRGDYPLRGPFNLQRWRNTNLSGLVNVYMDTREKTRTLRSVFIDMTRHWFTVDGVLPKR